MCLAVYTLAGGKILRGFMVKTLADRLGIDFHRASAMADAAHAAGLVRHEHGTVTLTGEGHARGATLKPPKAS
jgi:Mn-dependent DtxR family transcriptional regulator